MNFQALPYILTLGFLFGTTLIASRFAVGQFQPIVYIGLRMLLATMAYGLVYAVTFRRRTFPANPQLWRHAILLGIFGTAVPMVGVVSSLQYLSAGVVAILITAGPAVTILIAHFFLADERLNLQKAAGIALAITGALLIAVKGESGLPDVSQANPLGYILVLTGMTVGSAMTVYARKHMQDYDTLNVASIRMLTATMVIMPVAVLFIGIDLEAVTGQGYTALFYAALVGNFLGMFLAFYNIQKFGATAAAMTDYVIPVVAGLGGILILGEQITAGMIMGMLLIGLGLAFINQFRRATPKAV